MVSLLGELDVYPLTRTQPGGMAVKAMASAVVKAREDEEEWEETLRV